MCGELLIFDTNQQFATDRSKKDTSRIFKGIASDDPRVKEKYKPGHGNGPRRFRALLTCLSTAGRP